MKKSAGWKQTTESSDNELSDQIPLCFWHGVTCSDGKRQDNEGEFPAEFSRFKKLNFDVQGKKLINFAEELCKAKKWNGGLVKNFGCDAILYPQKNFSVEGIRENVDEECHPCHDGNNSKNLISDWCEPNAATNYSEDYSPPTVIAETPSQSNPTRESRFKPIQAQSGGGLRGSTKALIILVGLDVPTIILFSLRGA